MPDDWRRRGLRPCPSATGAAVPFQSAPMSPRAWMTNASAPSAAPMRRQGTMSPTAGKPNRGIRIALSRESWELICEALAYVVEKPHLDDLEESRGRIGKVLRHIREKLGG